MARAIRLIEPDPDFGVTETLALDSLSVDRRYQVPINDAKVREIAQAFDPLLFPPLTVSRRKDGSCVILDGQHRWVAAVELDLKSVSCEVFDGLTYEQEAHIFAERNKRRRTPHPLAIFNARAEAGTQPHASIANMVRKFGYTIPRLPQKGGGHAFCCPGDLQIGYEWDALFSALHVIREAWYGESDATRGFVVLGVAAFLKNWPEADDEELLRKLRVEHLTGPGIRRLLADSINRQHSDRDRRLWAHFAQQLHGHYNAGRRNRLPDRPISKVAGRAWRKVK